MDSELRQRGLLAVRVVAALLGVAVLLLLTTRSGGGVDGRMTARGGNRRASVA